MKKLIVIPMTMLACAGAYAQGQLAYANNSSTKVMLNPTPANAGSATVATSTSGVEVELFYQIDNGGAAPTGITSSGALGNWEGTQITGISTIPGGGIFSGPVLNLSDIAGGATVWIDIVGWNGSAQSLGAALAPGSATSLFGSSAVFAQVTANPNGTPPTTPSKLTDAAPGAFNGLTLNPIPEPTTMALGALGAVSLLAFRRKK
jgi:hypothetical protein